MDINLPDMLGSEATTTMRAYEKEYSFLKSVIIAVSVEGKNNVGKDDLFNDYCKIILIFYNNIKAIILIFNYFFVFSSWIFSYIIFFS
jgi:hypothetical protein